MKSHTQGYTWKFKIHMAGLGMLGVEVRMVRMRKLLLRPSFYTWVWKSISLTFLECNRRKITRLSSPTLYLFVKRNHNSTTWSIATISSKILWNPVEKSLAITLLLFTTKKLDKETFLVIAKLCYVQVFAKL